MQVLLTHAKDTETHRLTNLPSRHPSIIDAESLHINLSGPIPASPCNKNPKVDILFPLQFSLRFTVQLDRKTATQADSPSCHAA